MATKLKEIDAVVIGMGFSGAILSRELTKAGLNVVGLERGEDLTLTRIALDRIESAAKAADAILGTMPR